MNIFNNIRSHYILQIVFDHLETDKTFNIVKYNNHLKKRLDININDYKEYSENYSSIEIELKPFKYVYATFINYKIKDEKYYHIYFNNNEEEIKRKYINKNEKIDVIKIIIDYQI